MYIMILTFQKPLDKIEKYMEAHKAYVKKYHKENKFILTGRINPKKGGVTIFQAENRGEAEQLMKEDPFYIYQIASFEIIEFQPTAYINGLEKLVDIS